MLSHSFMVRCSVKQRGKFTFKKILLNILIHTMFFLQIKWLHFEGGMRYCVLFEILFINYNVVIIIEKDFFNKKFILIVNQIFI
jgi:hypothetical protein